ncbi:MAG TPA: hypothetical protein VNA69_03630 [Thermoanaerobaculia bacterium]|nr:hypothetical protein [Thermoanaerobaculia bacterium]
MIRTPLSTTSVLDEAAEVVRLAAPWSAVIVLTSIPYRFLQAVFFDQLAEAGSEASRYGNLLGGTANLIVAAILLAFWGRAVYARACRLAHGRGTAPGREAWRVSKAAFASYVLTGSAAFLAGFVTCFTLAGFVVAVMFAGLAIGTMELNERISIATPFRNLFRSARTVAIPMALVFVFFCALVVAFVNLAAAFGLGIWLATAIGGFDAPHWPVLFGLGNRRFVLMLVAGALVAVEPFWVAAHVVFVRKAGAQESGDDLRAWFEELQRAS